MSERQDVLDYFSARQEQMVADTALLAKVESHTNDVPSLEKGAYALEMYASAALGCEAKWHWEDDGKGGERRPHLQFDLGEKPEVLLIGHFDTVHPVGTLAKNPVRIEADYLYGPGVLDMKSGVVVMTEVARYIQNTQKNPNITLVFNSDEEISSPTSGDLLRKVAADSRVVLVFEFSIHEYLPKIAARGIRHILFTLKGKGAHAAYPEHYINPVMALADILEVAKRLHDPDNGLVVTPTMVSGSHSFNSVADEATLLVDIRGKNLELLQYAEQHLQSIKLSDERIEMAAETVRGVGPFEMFADNYALQLACSAADRLGLPRPEALEARGASDANQVAGVQRHAMEGLGCWGEAAHHPTKERVYIPSFAEAAARAALMVEEALADGAKAASVQ